MTPWLPSALVNHLWQSTLLVVLVWLAARALRRNRARVRYWLWTAASVKFLVPLSALMSLGQRFEWRTLPAIARPAVSFVMEDVLAPAVVAVAAPASSARPFAFVPWLLLAVWVAGVVAVLFSWRRQWLPMRSALRLARPVQLDTQHDSADLVVMSSLSVLEPGVFGIRRPVLLLPDGLVDRLTSVQLRALIAHERCHIRCHDNLAATMHMAVEAIFWFHPLVWWIETQMIDERERACDEDVLRLGSQPRDYAEGILEVCRFCVESPLPCVAGVTGSHLGRRVEAIMRNQIGRPMTIGRRLAVACAAVAVIGGPVAGGAMKSPTNAQVDAASARPKFEVASVKLNRSSSRRIALGGGFLPGGRFSASNIQLASLITAAYQIPPKQLDSKQLDDALLDEKFDIEAKAGTNALLQDAPMKAQRGQLRLMLQELLTDRFKLAIHKETRELPLYALVVARNGPRLTPSPPDPDCDTEVACRGFGGGPANGLKGSAELSGLAATLTWFLERQVVDRTGIQGRFDIELPPWSLPAQLVTPRAPDNDEPAPNASDPSIFTVLQERLGLRLESTRGPLDIYVVDHIERPAPD